MRPRSDFGRGTRRSRLFTWGAIASFGVVAVGVTIHSAIIETNAEHALARAAKSRVEIAAACGCALARVVGPSAMRDVTFEQVRPRSDDDDAYQTYPSSRTSFVAQWMTDEALLPAASYVMSYRIGD